MPPLDPGLVLAYPWGGGVSMGQGFCQPPGLPFESFTTPVQAVPPARCQGKGLWAAQVAVKMGSSKWTGQPGREGVWEHSGQGPALTGGPLPGSLDGGRRALLSPGCPYAPLPQKCLACKSGQMIGSPLLSVACCDRHLLSEFGGRSWCNLWFYFFFPQ